MFYILVITIQDPTIDNPHCALFWGATEAASSTGRQSMVPGQERWYRPWSRTSRSKDRKGLLGKHSKWLWLHFEKGQVNDPKSDVQWSRGPPRPTKLELAAEEWSEFWSYASEGVRRNVPPAWRVAPWLTAPKRNETSRWGREWTRYPTPNLTKEGCIEKMF